jgi:hypothetical protein
MRLLLLCLATGCAPLPAPDSAVAAYRAALRADDPRGAYRLLSAAERARTSEQDFVSRWRTSARERSSQALALADAHARLRALATVGDERQPLVLEREGWRVVSPERERRGAATPDELIGSLIDALTRRDTEAFLALLAEPLRASLLDALGERLSRLQAYDRRPGNVTGEQVRVRYDPRFFLELRREGDRWKIADFN